MPPTRPCRRPRIRSARSRRRRSRAGGRPGGPSVPVAADTVHVAADPVHVGVADASVPDLDQYVVRPHVPSLDPRRGQRLGRERGGVGGNSEHVCLPLWSQRSLMRRWRPAGMRAAAVGRSPSPVRVTSPAGPSARARRCAGRDDTAVDQEVGAGDEGGLPPGQERRCLGDLLRRADAPAADVSIMRRSRAERDGKSFGVTPDRGRCLDDQ